MAERYSDYFTTIYDENGPVGHLGRGTHYSVMRYASWLDVERRILTSPQTHDFAVIWDEDHDTRIFFALEKILEQGLLSPIQFIGERKAFLSIVVAARFYYSASADIAAYREALQQIASDVDGDHWNLELGFFDRSDRAFGYHHQTELPGMISCGEYEQDTYLRNIDNVWGLGTKKFIREPSTFVAPPFPPMPTSVPSPS